MKKLNSHANFENSVARQTGKEALNPLEIRVNKASHLFLWCPITNHGGTLMYSVFISLSHCSKERAVVYSDWTGWDNMSILATTYR